MQGVYIYSRESSERQREREFQTKKVIFIVVGFVQYC